ncbi:MAG: hypothetical protein LW837_06505 [Roseomonas sp.]|nr:hypothetical protein [Roseomonas sp.]
MMFSERRLAILAIVIGLVGVLPFLPAIAMLTGHTRLFLVLSILSWPSNSFFRAFAFLAKESPNSFETARYFFQWFIAPTLLLWGLLKIQRNEQARFWIIVGTCVLCAATLPFVLGFMLILPLFLCGFLPMAIRFKNRDRTKRLGPEDGQAP